MRNNKLIDEAWRRRQLRDERVFERVVELIDDHYWAIVRWRNKPADNSVDAAIVGAAWLSRAAWLDPLMPEKWKATVAGTAAAKPSPAWGFNAATWIDRGEKLLAKIGNMPGAGHHEFDPGRAVGEAVHALLKELDDARLMTVVGASIADTQPAVDWLWANELPPAFTNSVALWLKASAIAAGGCQTAADWYEAL